MEQTTYWYFGELHESSSLLDMSLYVLSSCASRCLFALAMGPQPQLDRSKYLQQNLAAVSLSGYGESSQLGTPGQATAQISGTEQQTLNCHSVPNGEDCVPVTYDQGIVGFVIVAEDQNGHFITDQVFNVNYAAFDDPLSIATRLADAVNQSSTALVTATSNGDGSVTVVSKTSGVPTNYSIDGLAYSTGGYPNDQTYNPASFSISLPSTLSGGTDPQP